ncbi:hypothetical protein G7054_g12336 [Neopestalotiopsis clavispora]|nr:hypothetical protein G7054_g12336 [Neopestalotiopsis clavispora]
MGSSASKEKGESSARHYLDESDHWSGDCPCVSYASELPFPKRALYNMHAEPISTLLSSLPPEELAIGPLDTLHPTMPYELEFHHLDTVLNDMKGTYYIADHRSSVCFVPELSDTCTAQFYENGLSFDSRESEACWNTPGLQKTASGLECGPAEMDLIYVSAGANIVRRITNKSCKW